MASVSFLARSVARRSVDKLVRVNPQQVGVASSLLGSVRWSTSYFTPGKKRIANKQEPACLPACCPKLHMLLGLDPLYAAKRSTGRSETDHFHLNFRWSFGGCNVLVLWGCFSIAGVGSSLSHTFLFLVLLLFKRTNM